MEISRRRYDARVRGRPHTTWQDTIKTWTGLSLLEACESSGELLRNEEDHPQCSHISYYRGEEGRANFISVCGQHVLCMLNRTYVLYAAKLESDATG